MKFLYIENAISLKLYSKSKVDDRSVNVKRKKCKGKHLQWIKKDIPFTKQNEVFVKIVSAKYLFSSMIFFLVLLLNWHCRFKPIYKYYKLKLMWQPWSYSFRFQLSVMWYAIKTGPVKSQCPKVILVLVQHWLFLSDQWDVGADV